MCNEAERKNDPDLKKIMLDAIRHAERCSYAYASSCEVGDERTEAFEIYEKVRTAIRRG